MSFIAIRLFKSRYFTAYIKTKQAPNSILGASYRDGKYMLLDKLMEL
jgi:hypothetical protein